MNKIIEPRPKKPGCCTMCGVEVFEIKDADRHVPPHPYSGDAKRLGAPKPNAVRMGFALASGSLVDLTFCIACADKALDDLMSIWTKCLQANRHQFENYEIEGGRKRTPLQIATQEEALRNQMADTITGVVYRVPWSDIFPSRAT